MLVAGESRKAFFLIPTQHRASRVRGGFSSPVVFQGLYLKAHGANSPHITSHVAAYAPRPTQHPQVLVFPVPPCWWLSGAKCFRKICSSRGPVAPERMERGHIYVINLANILRSWNYLCLCRFAFVFFFNLIMPLDSLTFLILLVFALLRVTSSQ